MNLLNETIIAETPVFNLVKRKIENVDFEPVALTANDWVMAIVMSDNDYRTAYGLVVTQTRWGSLEQTVEFPCGTVEELDFNNASKVIPILKIDNLPYKLAAAREFGEETGIYIDPLDFVQIAEFNPNPAYFDNAMHIMLAVKPLKYLEEKFATGVQSLDPHEDCKKQLVRIRAFENELSKTAIGSAALYHLGQLKGNDLA